MGDSVRTRDLFGKQALGLTHRLVPLSLRRRQQIVPIIIVIGFSDTFAKKVMLHHGCLGAGSAPKLPCHRELLLLSLSLLSLNKTLFMWLLLITVDLVLFNLSRVI